MTSKTFILHSKDGFHLRPAGILSKTARKFNCKTYLIYNNVEINVNSIMRIVAACIKNNSEYTIRCEGPEEKECLAEIEKLANNNFPE